MRFIRITPQVAVNADKIVDVYVSGQEDPDGGKSSVSVRLHAGSEAPYVYRRAKTFREAEAVLAALLAELEAG